MHYWEINNLGDLMADKNFLKKSEEELDFRSAAFCEEDEDD